jgi:hypothetical protein
MATVIEFSGDQGHWIAVDEDPEAVREAFGGAQGEPFALTHSGQNERIYVNPSQVACWYPGMEHEAVRKHQAEATESQQVRRFSDIYRPVR